MATTYRIAVIGDWESVMGFRALGLDAYPVTSVEEAKEKAFAAGVNRDIDPFMTLSFMALPVIPTLRITTRGVFDVTTQRYI